MRYARKWASKRSKSAEKDIPKLLYELTILLIIIGYIIYCIWSGDGSGVDNPGFD